MLEHELCSSRVLSPFREESGDEELSVLPRHTKVIVTGNNRTKSVLVGLQGVVKKAVGLGGWHWLVLKNGVEVKLQRNALSVLEHPTGNENTRASDRHVPLSSRNATASALSTGLLVDTNLEVSVPDAYRPPPAPIPFDAALGHPPTPSAAQGIHSSKSNEAVQTTNIGSGQETVVVNTQETCIKSDDAKELDCKAQNTTENESSKKLEIELPKPVESIVPTKEEEDCCPTCLEVIFPLPSRKYDEENPKIITKCEHHFHLACIFEWMERSETCPVCDKEMIFDLPTN
ncbi:hypothetical protein GOBAR_AA38652 [Gossypium barbadense]|uniref:RING-type E3 ubiquitin transferase n=1 Tax=Gossypium barbadense TaxID=3634 RepID=A0A2P5VT95_GOSBA|nr:hypothetical protein GOBAR_AA38652 [Gossypium barbadense]